MGNLYTSLFTVDECPLVGLILRMSSTMNARLIRFTINIRVEYKKLNLWYVISDF